MAYDRVWRSRRRFLEGGLALAGLSLLSGCGLLPLQARQPAKLPRIGTLGDTRNPQWEAFRAGMRELGYVEGENLAIEWRWAQGDNARYTSLAAELVDLKVDCVVAGGISATIPAKPVNTTIPMVAIHHDIDVVESGLVANIARPEGNITGVAGASGLRLHSKLPEILKEALPDVKRLGLLASVRQPSVEVILEGVKDAARQLGMQPEVATVQDPGDIDAAFSALSAAGVQALAIVHTSIFGSARAQMVALTVQHRLPTITNDDQFPAAGGLMSYGVDRPDNYRYAATYVDKILKGAKPADLPMERPRKYDLRLNLKMARALGLTIPQTVLQQATEVIQ